MSAEEVRGLTCKGRQLERPQRSLQGRFGSSNLQGDRAGASVVVSPFKVFALSLGLAPNDEYCAASSIFIIRAGLYSNQVKKHFQNAMSMLNCQRGGDLPLEGRPVEATSEYPVSCGHEKGNFDENIPKLQLDSRGYEGDHSAVVSLRTP
jgi:hypothetical protein